MKKIGLFWAFSLLLATANQAQTADPFLELQRQMDKMMQELRSGYSFHFPPGASDTTFFFKLDTTLNGGNGSFFFDFSQPGTSGSDDTFGLDQLMKQFQEFGDQFNQRFDDPQQEQSPADDGGRRKGDGSDELLPEERLRQQEEGMQPKSGATPKPNVQKPKIKTSRI